MLGAHDRVLRIVVVAASLYLLVGDQALAGPKRPWASPGEYLLQAGKLPPSAALEVLADGHARFPADPPLTQAYAEQLVFAGAFSDAEKAFRECSAGEVARGFQTCWERCRLGMAVTLLHQGRTPDAVPILRALADRPSRAGWASRLYLARVAANDGLAEEAMARLAALRPAPEPEDEALLLAEEARVAWLGGDHDAAVAYLTAAQAISARPELQLLKTIVLSWKGDAAGVKKAVALVENDRIPAFAGRLPQLMTGAVDGKLNRDEAAEQIRLFPRELGGWVALIVDASVRGAVPEVDVLLEQALTATGSPLFRKRPPFLAADQSRSTAHD